MKKHLPLLVVLIAGFAIVGFLASGSSAPQDDNNTEIYTLPEKDENMIVTSSPDQRGFLIDSEKSSVTYSAQKEFFGKQTDVVEGVSTGLEGSIALNAETREVSAKAAIRPAFVSGEDHRDKTVQEMFGSEVMIALEPMTLDVTLAPEEVLRTQLPLEVTINDITQTLIFDVEARLEGEDIMVQGSSTLSLEAFEIKAPSLINVYSVHDEIGLAFSLTAS